MPLSLPARPAAKAHKVASRFVDVEKWLGQNAAPLDPTTMQFKSVVADDGARQCAGCVFRKQHWKLCIQAAALAVKAGSRDCDERDEKTRRAFVYVLAPLDPRQQSIFDALPLAVGDESEPKLTPNL